jgi:uncharacterized protein (DUF2147 family)
MKGLVHIGLLFALLVVAPLAAGDSDAVVGVWATDPDDDGGQAHIEIYRNGDRFDGKIVWLEEPVYLPGDEDGEAGQPKIDTENPDPELRTRPILGMVLMEGFVYDGKETWHKGTIYDANDGKTYKCKMRLEDQQTLKVRGFIGFSMIGRTEEWTRVKAKG